MYCNLLKLTGNIFNLYSHICRGNHNTHKLYEREFSRLSYVNFIKIYFDF